MRKTATVLLLIVSSMVAALGQQYYMTAPEGFGAGTTGGGNASPVTVTNENDFKTAVTASGAKVVLVSGTITFSAMMKVKIVDKTIVGLPGSKLVNNVQTAAGSGILYIQTGSSNVILRNLTFEGPGAYDVDGNDNFCAEGCTKLWIDHCDFQDGMDGNCDLKGGTDNVTISWCKFSYNKPPKSGGSGGANDHRFSNLIGSNADNAPADKHFSVTFSNCYWENCKERMPRARNSELHIVNCYYNTSIANAVALGLGGGANNLTCYVENTNFAKVATIYKNYPDDGGTVGLAFSNCLGSVPGPVGSVSKPAYQINTYPASGVAAAVGNTTCGAGATLKVSASGTISAPSNCSTPTGLESIEENVSKLSMIYPNPSEGSFILRSNDNILKISITNSSGLEVYQQENFKAGTETEINAHLENGIYFVKLRHASGNNEMIKLVKSK